MSQAPVNYNCECHKCKRAVPHTECHTVRGKKDSEYLFECTECAAKNTNGEDT